MSKNKDNQNEKKVDQFGNDVSETLKKEEEMEMVRVLTTRDELKTLYEERHERFSKIDLTQQGQFLFAWAHIQGAKALLAVTTKEKAKKAMADAVGDFAFIDGRAAAEARGNPKDLESYMKYQMCSFDNAPFIPYTEIYEDETYGEVMGAKRCPWAESVRQLAEMFPDYVTQVVIEVVASRCDKLDSGRTEGFKPNIEMKRVRFFLDDMIGNPPSDGCFFTVKMKEEE